VGLLAIALAFVTIYVLTTNTMSDRKAKLASLQSQVAQAQAAAARLSNYAQFAQLAQARAETVRQIAATRFDWHGALSDLSKVVPANTSLQSLFGSVAPGATVSGAGGSSGGAGVASSLRGDISAPAFELTGCTSTQDDVARLMSRLRLIDGVTRVTLGDSIKQEGSQPGATVSAGSNGSRGAAGCGPNTPTFDLVVFFQALASSASSSPGSAPVAAAAPVTTPGAASTISQPVSNTTPTSGGSK
jgi:Tfp pilus assembly protein PilN